MNSYELQEKVNEITELWVPEYVKKEDAARILKGYRMMKVYRFGKYGDIRVNVWMNGKNKLFEVVNTVTGATKCITKNWNEAYSMAKQLSARYKALYKLWGE